MTGGVFAILDDIAMLLDDTAAMSKLAAKKTAGILGDDLAVNAEKATGFLASRELPVLWEITKSSFINKLIILPLAFLMSAYASWLIIPILLVGGAYLSYEGMEKIFHVISHRQQKKPVAVKTTDKTELLKAEKTKIRSAVRTDFILSIEIVMIALGTVMNSDLLIQIIVVSFIAILATIGVYGLVALIVRMDDAGLYLIDRAGASPNLPARVLRWCGTTLVASLPYVIRSLSVIGTLAMLLVGGGMFVHNIDTLHHALEFLPPILANLLLGTLVGSILFVIELSISRISTRRARSK